MILTEQPKRLTVNRSLLCFACKANLASHMCRFKLEEATVQSCLCSECMGLETSPLFEKPLRYRPRDNDHKFSPCRTGSMHLGRVLEIDNDIA